MSILPAIAVYAAISKELGLPLRFPGKPGAYGTIYQVTEFRALRQGRAVGGDRAALRQPGLQHHQRRLLPLAQRMAEDRRPCSA